MIRTRPSSMPRVWDCTGSAEETDTPVNIPTDESDLGQAAHEALARTALGLDIDQSAIAGAHAVDVSDLEPLVVYGAQAWRELAPHFGSPRVEIDLDRTDITTGGRADLLHADGETLAIADWKSGRVRRNSRWQLASYAYAARAQFGMPRSGVIKAVAVWLRHGDLEVIDFDDAALDRFRAEYIAKMNSPMTYAPGEHCQGCPRQLECRAREAFMRSTALAIAEPDGELSHEVLATLYPRAQMLEKALANYRNALRAAVQQHGPLPIGDGRLLLLVEQHRDTIDARAAWEVLTDAGFTEDDFARATEIGKGAVEDIVGEKYDAAVAAGTMPKRQKGKRKAEVIDQLRKAGAVTTTTHQRLEAVKGE